jgi:transcriptional regulator with XRE-family HTH domain
MTENERFKFVIKALELSQQEFAEIIGMKPGSVSDVGRGKVGVSKKLLDKLESVFGVSRFYVEKGVEPIFIPGTENKRVSAAYTKKEPENSAAVNTLFPEDVWNNEIKRLKFQNEKYKSERDMYKAQAETLRQHVKDQEKRIENLKAIIVDLEAAPGLRKKQKHEKT